MKGRGPTITNAPPMRDQTVRIFARAESDETIEVRATVEDIYSTAGVWVGCVRVLGQWRVVERRHGSDAWLERRVARLSE